MRVLLSAYACDPFGGSEGANAWFTAEGLAHAGADVHILTRPTDAEKTKAGIRAYEAHPGLGRVTSNALPDSVPKPLAKGQVGVYLRYAAWQMHCHSWAQDPKNGTWDVGHHVSWGSLSHPVGLAGCPFPLFIGPVGGGQSLHPEHEEWLDGYLGYDRLRRIALRRLVPLNPLSRKAARMAAEVAATNQESLRLLRSLGVANVSLQLADGVREHALANEAPPFPSDLTIVWIGRFLPLKAARLAVESFRLLHQEEPRARLVMIGDGPTRGSTRECAADLERRGLVNFTGQLPWASAQKILASARVHLFTSVRDSFGAQILEASSVGVPTVAIDAYGAKAFLHRRGFGLADPLPGNSLDVRLAQQLLKFSTLNERQWREESRGALQFAGENRYRERASLLLSRYEELTKRPLRPEVGRT